MEREGYKGPTGRGARGRREAENNILFLGAKQTEHCCSYFECSLPLVLYLRQIFWDLAPPDEILGMAIGKVWCDRVASQNFVN